MGSVPFYRPPAELGKPVADPAMWIGQDLAADTSWLLPVSDGALEDLKSLAAHIRPRIAEDPNQLLSPTRDAPPFGRFAKTLNEVRHSLKDGLGLAVHRGLSAQE